MSADRRHHFVVVVWMAHVMTKRPRPLYNLLVYQPFCIINFVMNTGFTSPLQLQRYVVGDIITGDDVKT